MFAGDLALVEAEVPNAVSYRAGVRCLSISEVGLKTIHWSANAPILRIRSL